MKKVKILNKEIKWNEDMKEKIRGERNSNWKGNKVKYNTLHGWIRRNKPKEELCVRCKKKKPFDLSNISGKYKRDINDFEWLCRSCHMKKDGRMAKLLILGSKYSKKLMEKRVKLLCLICKKEFIVVFSQRDKSKFCSKKCMGISLRGRKIPEEVKKKISESLIKRLREKK